MIIKIITFIKIILRRAKGVAQGARFAGHRTVTGFARYLRFLAVFARNRAIAIMRWRLVRHYRRHLRRQRRRYFAWATLASLALQLLLPLAGLVTPLQANGLIKPTQKGPALFENQSPGFTAEFGDKSEPTAHRLRFEAEPSYNGYKNYNDYKDYTPPSAGTRIKEALLGTESKGVELRLVEIGQAAASAVQPTAEADYNNYKSYNNYKGYNDPPASEKLEDLQSQLQEVESGLKEVETGITAVSKDVVEVTKVTKNILEESGVGKPELSVRPSMEETTEDFAKTADPASAPPPAYTLPIDTISQTIDENTKVEYQVIVGRGVKESITILDKNYNDYNNYNSYTFELKLDPGVKARRALDGLADSQPGENNGYNGYPAERDPAPQGNNYGVIYFVDQFGRYLFHFETPYMIDAAGAKSSAVELKLDYNSYNDYPAERDPAPQGNSYKLRVTADQNWLMDPARIYPVLIDPTIVHEDNPAFASGTENRSQINSGNAVETQFKELQTDINTVGLWHFNEGSSTTAYDASGNNNTGTLTNGPVWNGPTDTLTGLGKSSLKYDDANDYVTTADAASLDLTTNGTIEAWVKPNAIEDNNWIVCKASNYCVGLNSTGAVLYTGASAQNDGGTGVTTANQWYHIAVTNNNTTATYYVNGVTTGTDAVAWGSTLTNALEFGRDGGTNYFDGTIDEIRISNVVRTPEEIAADASRFPYSVHESPVIDFGSTPNTLDSLNYTSTGVQTGDGEKPYSRDSLIAQWNFNETSGTVAYNTAGSDSCGGTPANCNGTLTTFASTSSQDQAAGTGWTANNRRWGAGALMFDGSNDYLAAINTGQSIKSVSFWINTNSTTDGILELVNNTNYISIASGAITATGFTSPTIYVNGTSQSAKLNPGWNFVTVTTETGITASSLIIGEANTDYFAGTLDAVKLYSRAITASEVLANSQVGNIEFQTRTGATATPNDGTWEAWKTTSGTGDTQIASMDTDSANWSEDNQNPASSGIVDSDDSTTKFEGTGSLKMQIGNPTVETSAVALYHLEETSGTGAYIQDSSATNADGTPTGTTVVDGFYGKARKFTNGYLTDYISTSKNIATLMGNDTSGSIDAWIYPTTTSGSQYILSDHDSAGSNNSGNFYVNASQLTVCFKTSSLVCATGGTINPNNWYHVAGTYNGSNVIAYVNGSQVNSAAQTGNLAGGTNNLTFGRAGADTADTALSYYGIIDEARLSTATFSAEEIAEAYRAGRDHRVSKTLNSNDLSSKTKLPFYVASDRTGTWAELSSGESALVNYEAGDPDLKGLWHLDENSNGSAAVTRKDSSGNGHDLTDNNTVTSAQGNIGKAAQFTAANSEYLSTADSPDFRVVNSDFTLSAWVYPNSSQEDKGIIGKTVAATGWEYHIRTTTGKFTAAVTDKSITAASSYNIGAWSLVTFTYTASTKTLNLYVNNDAGVSGVSTSGPTDAAGAFWIGAYWSSAYAFDGKVDEAMFLKRVLTADERRQMFEIGKRTHPITIDFKADLDSSNLITSTSDLSFAIQPDTDVTANSLNINKGEKIIVKENYNGTEYLAQGNVSNLTYESNTSNPNAWTQDSSSQGSVTTVTVTAWDSGSTVPSGGFTTSATVFKWQREYMDLTQIPLSTQRDAITRITLRVTDGSQGSNVWLDDFESADYSDGSRVTIGSTAQRYFQYRTILTSPNTQTSPTLTNVTVNYNSGTTAQPPKTKDASSDFTATGTSLNRVTDTGSSNSPSLELAYKELPKDINTVGLWHMNEASGTTNVADSSGNANTGTSSSSTNVTTGKLGNARSFNGTSNYIDVPESASLDLKSTQTMEFWVNPTDFASIRTALSRRTGSNEAFNIELRTTGAVLFEVAGTCAGALTSVTSNTLLSTGNWYHITTIYEASTKLAIYINGVFDNQNTTSIPASICDPNTSYTIGRINTATPGQYSNGQIDEVRISNIARSPEEIKLDAQHRPYGVYTSDVQNLGTDVSSIDNLRWTENGVQTGDGETPYNSNGLVAAWNFNETSGTTAANSTNASCGSTCNGTLTSMTTTGQDAAAGDGWTANNRKWGAGALMFDGTDGHVTIPNSNTVSSVEMWVNPTSVASINIMQLTATATVTTSAAGLITAGAGFTTPTIYLNGSTTDLILKAGVWNHVVVSSATGISTSSGYLGRVSTSYFKGVIDAVKLYNRALSATEILSNYQSGNVELQTRTGTTTTPNDGTWEEWRPSGNSTEIQLDNLQTLSPVQKINTTNLTAYWKLDEVSGSRADSAGSNTLTDNATVTSKAGHLNLAGQFTAANSEYLSIADNAALSTGDIDFSVSAWVYFDTNSNFSFVGKWAQTGDKREYQIYSVGTEIRFYVSSSGTAATTTYVAATTFGAVTTGNWYHIVGWHDSVNNQIGVSVNNVANTSSYSSGFTDLTGAFYIGADESGSYHNGRIDEVGFWKRVLTADERKTLYEDGLDKTNDSVVGGINRTSDTTTKFEGTGSEKLTIGAPQVDSSTVALWHMDETSGSGAYIKDATANANNGTPTGTTVVDGFYGKGRSFNGSSDYVQVADAASLEFTNGAGTDNSFSTEAWVKLSEFGSAHTIVSKWDGYPATRAEWNFLYSGSVLYTNMYLADGSAYIGRGAPFTAANYQDKWTHVAFTYSGNETNAGIKIYINGVQADNSDLSTGTYTGMTDTNVPVYIGARLQNGVLNLPWQGQIDEFRISNTARTADEIAEGYRAGRDHRISKSVSSVDLSAKSKVPFYVASDRPGTFLEATIGESAYANYEPDANTVGLWHLEEQLDASGSIKDSSGQGNNLTLNSAPTLVQGKIGKARNFDDSADYASCTDANCGGTNKLDYPGSGGWTVGAWINPSSIGTNDVFIGKTSAYWLSIGGTGTNCTAGKIGFASYSGSVWTCTSSNTSPTANNWYYVVGTYDGTNLKLYVNGVLDGGPTAASAFANSSENFNIGGYSGGWYFPGIIDEGSVSNTARTPDEIRQAYEIGKRTHTITNDFVTTPQAAYSSGTSVTINNPYGTTNLTDTLSIGETMIFKENVGGTETVSQAVVTGITNTSSVYGTVTLLAAPTFPSGGFTTNATVFKWQREFFDVTGILGSPGSSNSPQNPLNSSKDAISRITLRVTDGSQGANIWIDDIKAAGPYLTQSTTRTASITSTVRQYLQYRIIFSTTDPQVSPTVTSVSVQTHSSPVKVVGSDTLGADGSFDKDGNLHLGSNNVKKVSFYDRTKDQISYALDFDNSNDYVAIGTGPTSVKTVEFWVNPNSTSTEFIDLNGSAYINVASGTIGTTGFTSPTVYVDGAVTSTVVANKWQHIAVTTATGLNATALNFGKRSTSYFNGIMDEVALYSSALTAAQVTTDYNARRLAGTETGLVALYHFDEGQGTRAYDSVGGFHGTLTNMAATSWVNSQNDRDQSALSQQVLGVDPNWANGVSRESNALLFNGTSDYVSAGTTGMSTSSMTWSAWIYPTAASQGGIMSYDNGTSDHSIRMQFTSANKITIGIGWVADYTSNATLTLNTWNHIAVTKNSGSWILYINGMQDITASDSSASVLNSFQIGRFYNGAIWLYFTGMIDEPAIFNTIRTSAQISADYNSRRFKGNETGLVALWHMDEGAFNLCSGGTNDACDASSNTNDGAATGTTWVTDARAIMDNNARYVSLGASSAVNTDRGMELKITSTTAFQYRWQGDQTWTTPSTSTLSSYSFSSPAQIDSTGVYVGFDTTNGVFGDESYFLIPSWAIQQFSANRGTRRTFPERSYLVATDRSVDIIDADDNTLWMRTTNGVANNLLGTQTLNVPSGINMSQGQLVVSTNGTAGTGVYRLDFNRDVAYRYNVTNRTTGTNNLAKRNATDWSWGSADTGQNLIDSVVNDVSLLTSNGRLVMATANNTGLTKIANIMSNDTSYDYSDVTSNAYNRVRMAENYLSGTGAVGDMYALNSTNNALERWNNVVADAASETNGTPDATVNATSTPALFASAQTVNDLDVKTGTSLANAGNNTVFVAHNGGTTTFQENRATLASSSVKYYTKDYIGEEMVGDIRGSWPLNGLTDNSLKAQTLTNNGSTTFATSGVRGLAPTLNGSSQYLSVADNANFSITGALTIAAWIYPTSLAGDKVVIAKWGSNQQSYLLYIPSSENKLNLLISSSGSGWTTAAGNTALQTNQWYFVSAVFTPGSKMEVFVNGVSDGSNTTSIPASIYDSTPGLGIGFDIPNGVAGEYFAGIIDEPFVTATALTATQIQQMYVAGKEALNNKYRVKLASDTVNQLAGSINVVKGVAASDQYIFAGTNTTGADDGILSRTLLRGDVTDRSYDESTTDPLIVDNDINSVAVSRDGAYIVVGTDDQGITIIQNGSAANRLRAGSKVQGPYKRPHN